MKLEYKLVDSRVGIRGKNLAILFSSYTSLIPIYS